MTGREIIKTLLRREIPERVGLNEGFWPCIVENAWGAAIKTWKRKAGTPEHVGYTVTSPDVTHS